MRVYFLNSTVLIIASIGKILKQYLYIHVDNVVHVMDVTRMGHLQNVALVHPSPKLALFQINSISYHGRLRYWGLQAVGLEFYDW